MVILDISAASWTGRVRSQNEDMILVDNQFIRDDTYKTQIVLGREDRMVSCVPLNCSSARPFEAM